MTKSALFIFIFFLILCEAKTHGLNCTKCVCFTTRPHFVIECQHVPCDTNNLNDLLRFRRPLNVTLFNCAEETYFPHLMSRLGSAGTVKLHHLSEENPTLDAIEGHMKQLDLKHYTVRANTFGNLPQLSELTITSSRIDVDDPFRRLRNLRKLDLSLNEIISKLKTPKNVIARYNVQLQFNILDERTFEPLENLKRLNLSHNSLWIVEKEVFQHLVSVEEIDFGYNFIHAVETNAFVKNVKLRVLNLRNNRIKFNEAYGAMIYPKSLEILDLRSNNLAYFSAEWMKPAFTVDLRNNNINVLDLQLLQSALSQNVIFDVKETSDFNANYESAVFLSGNPVSLDTDLQNLVSFFDVARGNATLRDALDLPNLKCVKTKRYLCSPNENRWSFCPRKCECLAAPWEFTFIVNCTKRTKNEVPRLSVPNFWRKTEVHLEDNSLKSGPGKNMGFDSVTELYLSGNDVEVISWIPEKLEIFEIHDNNLGLLDMHIVETLNKSKLTTRITLHDNPWKCDCESSNIIHAMQSLIHHKQINAKSIKCGKSDALLINLTDSELCPTILKSILVLSVCLTALGLLSSTLIILYYRHGHDLKLYLFAKKLCLPCVKRREPYPDRKYDAFVCYTFKDEAFLCDHLLPVLEGGPNPYRICVHVRDWIAGELIIQQMIRSIEQSKRTIVIMSPDYLKSNWAMMELRFAYDRAVEGNAEIIIVLYRDVDVENLVDEDLKQYLKRCRFVKWKKPRFWDKLKYALPHSPGSKVTSY